MKRHMVALAMLAALPGAVHAADWVPAEAQVQWRHEPREQIIVEQTVWRCEGEICRGRVVDTPLLSGRACRAIARFAEGVIRFWAGGNAFDEEQLARCNGRR